MNELKRQWRFFRSRMYEKRIRDSGVQFGKDCRIFGNPDEVFGSDPWLITLGDHVSITSGVRFVTHDGAVWVLRHKHKHLDVHGRIRVGNNVFFGINSVILPGVTIGSNVVIGAGSVVAKDIPDNSVAAGVPARVITTIDEYEARSLAKGSSVRPPGKGQTPEQRRQQILDHILAVESGHKVKDKD